MWKGPTLAQCSFIFCSQLLSEMCFCYLPCGDLIINLWVSSPHLHWKLEICQDIPEHKIVSESDEQYPSMLFCFRPATEDLDEGMVSINVPSRVASSRIGPQNQNFYFGTITRYGTTLIGSSHLSSWYDLSKNYVILLLSLLGCNDFGSRHGSTVIFRLNSVMVPHTSTT